MTAIMTGTRQTGPSCAWAEWLASFRCLGNAPQRGGEPIPGFFVRQRLQNSVRSSRGGDTLTPPSSLQPRSAMETMPGGNSQNAGTLECAALNKDPVSRIGPSHLMFACSYLFVSIRVPFPPVGVGGGRLCGKPRSRNQVVGCWKCGCVGYQLSLKEHQQPRAINRHPDAAARLTT